MISRNMKMEPSTGSMVEIHVDCLKKVLSVPVQAIVQIGEDNWCYAGTAGDIERRTVGLLRVDSGKLELLELPDPTATRVVDFSWSADGRLLRDRESDTAVDRWLHVVDPATGNLTERAGDL